MHALKIRTVTKPESGEVDSAKAVRRQALAKEIFPERTSVPRYISLTSSGYNEDDKGIL